MPTLLVTLYKVMEVIKRYVLQSFNWVQPGAISKCKFKTFVLLIGCNVNYIVILYISYVLYK